MNKPVALLLTPEEIENLNQTNLSFSLFIYLEV